MASLCKEFDFKDIYSLYLILGRDCNMSCRHCTQAPFKKPPLLCTLSSDVDKLLDNFIKWSLSINSSQQHIIKFYGGEALLYWDLIKSIVIKYSIKYNILSSSKFRFVIMSNGLLLNHEIVDFCNQYGIRFILSYDAPNPFFVRGFIGDSVINNFLKINDRVIRTGFSSKNCDFYEAYLFLKNKFPNTNIDFSFDLILTHFMPKDIYNFDFDVVSNNFKKLRIAIKLGKSDVLKKFVLGILLPIKYSNLNSFFLNHNIKPCFSGKYHLSVMLDGSIVSCHNSSLVVGNVYDSLSDIFNASYSYYKQHSCSFCLTCLNRDICHGGCCLSLKDTDGQYLSCKLYRNKIFSLFKEEMSKLAYDLTDDEIQWFNQCN